MAKFDRFIVSTTAMQGAGDDYNLILEVLFEDGDIISNAMQIATDTLEAEKTRIEQSNP